MKKTANRNHDSRWYDGVTRRKYLRSAGAAGFGGLSSSAALSHIGTVAAVSHTLTIEGTGSLATYIFSVSGDLEKSTANGANINTNDEITTTTVTGEVGISADSYTVSGDIESFALDGDAEISFDGERIDPTQYPDHVVTIRGTGPRATYTFAVSGTLEKSTANNANINTNDEIAGSTASGEVGISADSYVFSGELTIFALDDNADVFLDGERLDPSQYPNHVLTIEGTGSRATYAFSVSEALEKSTANNANINSGDEITGSTASGEVGISADSYAFSGDIESFSLDGDANVFLDGNRLATSQYPDHVLTIEGTGSRASYEFSVSDALEKSTTNNANINSGDEITGSTASGEVGISADSYVFSGVITDFELDGNAKVSRDGESVDPGSFGNTDLKLGYDARARSHRRGDTFDDFSDLSKAGGWYATNGGLSLDTERKFHDNDPSSARLDGYSGDDRIGMAIDFPGGRAFSHRDLSLAVRLGEAAHETLRVELYAQTASDQFIGTRYLSRKHGWVRVDLGASNIRGSPNLGDVRQFGIECYTGGKRVRMNIDAIRTTPKRDRGAVILTFDDADRTHYTNAFSEMRSRGMPGTCAIIPQVVGDSGNLTLSQMREMQNDGWTMASHPQAPHRGLGSIPADEAEQMMRDTKRWLLNHGFDRGARCLIWPFGDFDHDAMELAGEYHELSFGGGSAPCGGTVTETAWVPRVNTDDVGNALNAIDYAARYDTVVTLMSHPVGTSRLPMADFRRLLDRVEARNLDVLTASDFADEQ